MNPGDNWRIKRRACSFYVPYINRIATTGHSHGQDAEGKTWTGQCIFKGLSQTSWFTCHECYEHQDRSHWPITFCMEAVRGQDGTTNIICTPKPKKPRKLPQPPFVLLDGLTINRIYYQQLKIDMTLEEAYT